jgi:hypothetical protein
VPLDEHITMGKLAQILPEHAQAQRWAYPVARSDELLRVLDQAKVTAAADQRVVVPGILPERGDRCAKEWKRLGSIAPPGSVVETATALARQIAANPPLSVQATVRACRWFMDQAERAAMAITDPMKLYLTEDFREALAAHLDKRKPRPFRGR